MMRTVFWILLLANAVFFAAMRWGGSLTVEPAAQLQAELHAEKVHLLTASQPAAQPEMPRSAPLASSSVAASSEVVAVPAKVDATRMCQEWGEFSGPDLARASSALAALHLGERLGKREIEHVIGFWVYIPPLKDKAAVDQKIEQLKARGITEYFVVQDAGPWLNAISLGVFKTREAAQNFVIQLRAKDVRTAQVGERSGKQKVTVFVLNGLDAAISGKLAALRRDFPTSEIKEISCTH